MTEPRVRSCICTYTSAPHTGAWSGGSDEAALGTGTHTACGAARRSVGCLRMRTCLLLDTGTSSSLPVTKCQYSPLFYVWF